MKKLYTIMILSLVLTACTKTTYVPLREVIRDTTIVRDTTIQATLIPYKDSVSVRDTASYLFNPYGYSWAIWDNGILHHSLGIFPNAFVPVRFFYLDRIRTITKDVSVPVERKLTKWETIKMDVGGWAIGGMSVFLLYIIIWLIKRFR